MICPGARLTAGARSAAPDRWVPGGVTALLAPWQGQQKPCHETRLKSVVSGSPLLDRAYLSGILMLGGVLLKSWIILILQEFCGSLLEFSWSLLRIYLAGRNELGPESRQTLGHCDTSILNFCLWGSQWSWLGEKCQAVITVLGWCSFESLCKSLLD